MSRLLVVHHAPSPRTQLLLDAIRSGTAHPELSEVEVAVEPALGATSADALAADAFVLLTTANFGYMSGALKHFFDTAYYPCLGSLDGRPYALVVHGDDDTTGAVASVERIAESWGLRRCAPPVSSTGEPAPADREAVADLAATVAAQLLA